MKKAGVLLIVLGIVSVFLAFNMDVVVGTSYNIGLLNERQNIVYLSGVLFLAGIILFGFGVVAKEESENLKMFTLWAVLTPIVLFVIIKIILDIQAELLEQAEEARYAEQVAAEQVEQAKQAAKQAALEARYAKQVAQEKRASLKILQENTDKFLQENTDKFVDNKNGTVTFKVTGLTWQKCSVGQIWTGKTCSGEAKQMIWGDAMKLSSSFAEHNDWRLPTEDELKTLVFCVDNEYNVDGSCTNGLLQDKPTINSVYFPNTQSTDYWSSSPVANDSNYARVINFGYSYSSDGPKYFSNVVRLVR